MEYLSYILIPEGLNGPSQSQHNPELAGTPKGLRCPIIPELHHLLPEIHNYSKIAAPLTRLTKKRITWYFSDECRATFTMLNAAFTMALILSHWIPRAPTIIKMDTSNYAIAAILSTTTADGKVHPVAFHSQKMNPAELNYNTHDKELLAIH
jgi:hypothetical protein